MIAHAKQPEFWEKVKKGGVYQPLLDDLFEKYEAYCKGPIESLPFDEYQLYYTTGSRAEYEQKFFRRRARLNTFALLSLIYGDAEYISGLENTIWAICDEVTWEVPAHLPNNYEEFQQKLALFSCETGFALSEILYLLEDKLNPMVCDRAKEQLDRRIITVFLNNALWWEQAEMNWSAVCAGSVGAVFLYRVPEKLDIVLPRLLHSMECFLRGFGQDGACREGLGYWNYGFGFFIHFADLLKDFTNGKIDLLEQDVVKKVAAFQHKIFLQGNTVVSFSDGQPTSKCIFGLTNYLQKRFPGQVFMPKVEGIYDDNCFRWATFLRNFLWLDEAAMAQHETGLCSYYFPEAQWKIVKGSKYAFAAKGGNNNEPHNHNDVGSFIVTHNNQQVLCDLGAGEYTKDYFRHETRYNLLVNSSRGHSVPVVNGQYQKFGDAYAGQVVKEEERLFELELQKAYDLPELTSLTRRFELEDAYIKLTDRFEFSKQPVSVVDRLICTSQPVIEDGRVLVDGVEIGFNGDVLSCMVSKETYQSHYCEEKPCYMIDFAPKQLTEQVEVTLSISILH